MTRSPARPPAKTPKAQPRGFVQPDLTDPAVIADALVAFPAVAASAASRHSTRLDLVPFVHWLGDAWPALIESLEPDVVTLAHLAIIHDGVRLDELPDLVVDAEGFDPDHLLTWAQRLCVAGLAVVIDGRLLVDAVVADVARLPLPSLQLSDNLVTSEQLNRACRLWNLDGGTRKADRLAALVEAMSNPQRLAAQLGVISPEARTLLGRFIATSGSYETPADLPPGSVPLQDVSGDPDLIFRRRVQRYGRTTDDHSNPFDELTDHLLIGEMTYDWVGWAWLEVAISLQDGKFGRWLGPAVTPTKPIDDAPGAAAVTVAAACQLLDAVRAEPLEAKRSGDRRPVVKASRAAGTVAGVPGPFAVALVELLIDVGLLVPYDLPAVGRGRNAEVPVQWRVHPVRVDEFLALPLAAQWALLATDWFHPQGGTPAAARLAITRASLAATLGALPDGEGIARSELLDWLDQRALVFHGDTRLGDAVNELVSLGLATDGPVCGLTPAGRALLSGSVAAVVDAVGDVAATFVVQPDHTILAPNHLAPSVRAGLAAIAEVESSGGATMWRLSPQRLTEVGATRSADEVVAFLVEHAETDVPASIERLVRDTVGGGRRLEVCAPATIVRCDDPMLLADAARHKTAKLTLLAPTVATTPLTPAKITDILRKKGVALTVTDAGAPAAPTPAGRSTRSGATTPTADAVPPGSWAVYHLAVAKPLPAPKPAPAVTLAGATALANKRLATKR